MSGLLSNSIIISKGELSYLKDILINVLEGASTEDVAGDIEEAIELIDSLLN